MPREGHPPAQARRRRWGPLVAVIAIVVFVLLLGAVLYVLVSGLVGAPTSASSTPPPTSNTSSSSPSSGRSSFFGPSLGLVGPLLVLVAAVALATLWATGAAVRRGSEQVRDAAARAGLEAWRRRRDAGDSPVPPPPAEVVAMADPLAHML